MEEKMKEKKFTIEEAFCSVPELREYFQRSLRNIDDFDKFQWEPGATKEAMIKHYNILLGVFESLTVYDLDVCYYMRALRHMSPRMVSYMLQDYYETELRTESFLCNEPKRNPLKPFGRIDE